MPFFSPFSDFSSISAPIWAPCWSHFRIMFHIFFIVFLASILCWFRIDFTRIFNAQNHELCGKTKGLERFRLFRQSMKNQCFWCPFWHHFGSLLALFFDAFSVSISECLFGCLFSGFWSKMVLRKVKCERVAEAFGQQRAPKATQRPPKIELFPATVFE